MLMALMMIKDLVLIFPSDLAPALLRQPPFGRFDRSHLEYHHHYQPRCQNDSNDDVSQGHADEKPCNLLDFHHSDIND